MSSGWFNGMAMAPISGQMSGSPMAFSYILSGTAGLRHSVFFVTSAGTLQEFWWWQWNGPWDRVDQGAPSSTNLSSSPNGYAY